MPLGSDVAGPQWRGRSWSFVGGSYETRDASKGCIECLAHNTYYYIYIYMLLQLL